MDLAKNNCNICTTKEVKEVYTSYFNSLPLSNDNYVDNNNNYIEFCSIRSTADLEKISWDIMQSGIISCPDSIFQKYMKVSSEVELRKRNSR